MKKKKIKEVYMPKNLVIVESPAKAKTIKSSWVVIIK